MSGWAATSSSRSNLNPFRAVAAALSWVEFMFSDCGIGTKWPGTDSFFSTAEFWFLAGSIARQTWRLPFVPRTRARSRPRCTHRGTTAPAGSRPRSTGRPTSTAPVARRSRAGSGRSAASSDRSLSRRPCTIELPSCAGRRRLARHRHGLLAREVQRAAVDQHQGRRAESLELLVPCEEVFGSVHPPRVAVDVEPGDSGVDERRHIRERAAELVVHEHAHSAPLRVVVVVVVAADVGRPVAAEAVRDPGHLVVADDVPGRDDRIDPTPAAVGTRYGGLDVSKPPPSCDAPPTVARTPARTPMTASKAICVFLITLPLTRLRREFKGARALSGGGSAAPGDRVALSALASLGAWPGRALADR